MIYSCYPTNRYPACPIMVRKVVVSVSAVASRFRESIPVERAGTASVNGGGSCGAGCASRVGRCVTPGEGTVRRYVAEMSQPRFFPFPRSGPLTAGAVIRQGWR